MVRTRRRLLIFTTLACCCEVPAAFLSSSPSFSSSSSSSSSATTASAVRRRPGFWSPPLPSPPSPTARFLDLQGEASGLGGGDVNHLAEEARYLDLEARLFQAARAQRFGDAAAARDDMFRQQLDEAAAVICVNSDFYRAFSQKDVRAMGQVWLKRDDAAVSCVHPGQAPLLGHHNIMRTWTSMLASTDERFQSNVIQPSRVACSVKGSSAWVTCLEDVSVQKESSSSSSKKKKGKKGSTDSSSGSSLGSVARQMHATNVFRKVDGRWFLVHHHASPVPPSHASIGGPSPGTGRSTGAGTGRPTKKGNRGGKKSNNLAELLGVGVDDDEDEGDDEHDDDISGSVTIEVVPSYTSDESTGRGSAANQRGPGGGSSKQALPAEGGISHEGSSITLQEVLDRYKLLQEQSGSTDEESALEALRQAASASSSSLSSSSSSSSAASNEGAEQQGAWGGGTGYDEAAAVTTHEVALRPFRKVVRPPPAAQSSLAQTPPGASASAAFVDLEPRSFGWARDTVAQRIVHVTPRGQAERAGVLPGWKVASVDGAPVKDNAAFEAAVAKAKDRIRRARLGADTRQPRRRRQVEEIPGSPAESESVDSADAVGNGAEPQSPVKGRSDVQRAADLLMGKASHLASRSQDDTLSMEDEGGREPKQSWWPPLSSSSSALPPPSSAGAEATSTTTMMPPAGAESPGEGDDGVIVFGFEVPKASPATEKQVQQQVQQQSGGLGARGQAVSAGQREILKARETTREQQRSSSSSANTKNSPPPSSSSAATAAAAAAAFASEPSLRERTINVLRRLTSQEDLSSAEKTTLLGMIIDSPTEELSLVEVAFKLSRSPTEFADLCHVIAAMEEE